HGIRLTAELETRLAELQERTRELEASRRRIVAARDEERKRLETQVEQRIDRRLVNVAAALERAGGAAMRSKRSCATMLERITEQANAIQEELRDLARGVFPPLLSDRGIVVALQSQIRRSSLDFEIEGAEDLAGRRFNSHVEAAVYFCCLTVIDAAGRPRRASSGTELGLRLGASGGRVEFRIEGPRPGRASMVQIADRVEALGGTLAVEEEPGNLAVLSGSVPDQPDADAQTSARRSGSKRDFVT
ncbi:MAG: hypothetical protein ACRDJM_03940, partial [Actinomycetota bacterium]